MECTASDFSSPIYSPKPRAKDSDGAAFWYGSLDRSMTADNPDGHHEGVDILGVVGQTPVKAVADGVIQDYRAAYPCGSVSLKNIPGTAYIIKHDCTLGGQPVFTKYCHLDERTKVVLASGTIVKKGQIIGHVGKSGNAASTEISPHLHIEYIKGGSFNSERLLRNGAKDFDPVANGYLPRILGKPGSS